MNEFLLIIGVFALGLITGFIIWGTNWKGDYYDCPSFNFSEEDKNE